MRPRRPLRKTWRLAQRVYGRDVNRDCDIARRQAEFIPTAIDDDVDITCKETEAGGDREARRSWGA